MILIANWRSSGPEQERTFRFRTGLGRGVAWLKERGGRGELAIHTECESGDEYVEPERMSALGAFALAEIPEIAGRGAALRVSPVPSSWLAASERLLTFLRGAGFKAGIEDKALRLSSGDISPTILIRRTGACLFALDAYAQRHSSSKCREEVRAVALRHLDAKADEILSLLDEERGGAQLRRLLVGYAPAADSQERDAAVISALKKIQARTVIQFDCGSGSLLKRLGQIPQFERLIGVEPSAVLAERARKRCEPIAEIHRGSLQEPPTGLSSSSAALLIEALPPSADARLERTNEVLFAELGFEFVFCVERELWSRAELRAWAESIGSQYGYRAAFWQIGWDSAVLFRRLKPRESSCGSSSTGRSELMTRGDKRIQISSSQWMSTLDSFSRWTVDPRWLLYLPPGMCSRQSAEVSGALEHPQAAFDYYRDEGISKVVVELKHMGSRAIAVICKDEDAAERRFGIQQQGCIYTRNGRPFLKDDSELLAAFRDGLSRARFWERFNTDWVCLDGELLPWTLKAEHLLQQTHGEVLSCAEFELNELHRVFKEHAPEELSHLQRRKECFRRYRQLYEKYQAVEKKVRFAPFHLIATEGRSYFKENHQWHMQTLGALARKAEIFMKTPFQVVELGNKQAVKTCVDWWDEVSSYGNEGLVVKPLYFVPQGRRGAAQPALKCRGAEHLRLVYGPEYDLPEQRLKLATRGALARRREKHRRVLKQFALSIEGVERFVARDSIARVKECVRGVIALESREV